MSFFSSKKSSALIVLLIFTGFFLINHKGLYSVYSVSMTEVDAERFLEVKVSEFAFNGSGQPYESGTGTFFQVFGTFEIWNTNNFVVNRTFTQDCGFYLVTNPVSSIYDFEPDFVSPLCQNIGDIEFYTPGVSEQSFSGLLKFDNLALDFKVPNGNYEFTILGTDYEITIYGLQMTVNSENIVLSTDPIPENWGEQNVVPSDSYMTQVWTIKHEAIVTSVFSSTSAQILIDQFPIELIIGIGIFVLILLYFLSVIITRSRSREQDEYPSEKYYKNNLYCQSCGTQNEQNDQFCANCGYLLK